MDWPLAISKNRERLLAIVDALVALLGLSQGGRLTTLPHYLYHKALAILRPAEAAVRRLIVMAAQDLVASAPRNARSDVPNFALFAASCEGRLPIFNLIEPLKNFNSDETVYFFAANSGSDIIDVHSSNPSQTIPAANLCLRLLALKNALDTLPAQAKRLTRWYAARDLALAKNQPHRLSPMRPGLPPAWRNRHRDPVHKTLHDCHSLALLARDRRDSSRVRGQFTFFPSR
jgi:hypothetical protein